MGGLAIQTDFYNVATAIVMLAGRFGTLVLVLALAGGLVRRPRNARTRGTLSTTTVLFGSLLAGTVLIVTALTFVPADALGPVAEHLLLRHGSSF